VLRVAGLSAFYGELQAIEAVTFDLNPGETLAIIGANGAGKSTLLRAIAGLMSGGSARLRGSIAFGEHRLDSFTADVIVDRGVALVPEGRRLFSSLSVEDNLLCGAYLPRCRSGIPKKLAEVYALFPRLLERRRQVVSQMSGGEQQMVAIGRALMSSPRLLLLDELSLGLSPAMVDDIYRTLGRIVGDDLAVVLVEQDLRRALRASVRFIVMLEGRIVLQGRSGDVDEAAITAAYFGLRDGAPSDALAGAHP
jgi:branched-chain amino acid transport system ATP-binding protein